MATTERDYYELLGVPRDADDAQIKKAFRALARKLHPDVSDDPDAEERFKEVAEAYEVLSNRETRQLYDRYGHAGLRSGGFQPHYADFGSLGDIFSAFFGEDVFVGGTRGGRARGGDVAVEVEVELVDAAHGAKREVVFDVGVTCDTCAGSGARPGTQPVVCAQCGGAGRVQQVSRTVFGEFVRTQTCPRCGGGGRTVEEPCPTCAGSGRELQERRLEVEIPEGIHDGQRIRIGGQGHVGSGYGARAGDLYVLVHVRPDPRFQREGDDIYSQVDLTVTQAALGATVSVPTLDGDVELEFEPGTQPGAMRVLRGRGMPRLQAYGTGDQRVLVNVTVPRRLSERQRELLEEFEQLATHETYQSDDEGFFHRVRNFFR
jgi:molecular chaperone DnaJ